jgi:hypothetical protein
MATHALFILGLPFCGVPFFGGPWRAAACAAVVAVPLLNALMQLCLVVPGPVLLPGMAWAFVPFICTIATPPPLPLLAAIKAFIVSGQACCAALPWHQSALLFFVTPAGSAASVCGQPPTVPVMVPLTPVYVVVVVVFVLAIFKNPCVVLVSGIA